MEVNVMGGNCAMETTLASSFKERWCCVGAIIIGGGGEQNCSSLLFQKNSNCVLAWILVGLVMLRIMNKTSHSTK
jgi:hypothetical protein